MNIAAILEEVRKMEAALARFKSELKRQQALAVAAELVTYPLAVASDPAPDAEKQKT